jgi:hypothetical protein
MWNSCVTEWLLAPQEGIISIELASSHCLTEISQEPGFDQQKSKEQRIAMKSTYIMQVVHAVNRIRVCSLCFLRKQHTPVCFQKLVNLIPFPLITSQGMDETTYPDLLHGYSRSALPICKHQIIFWFTPPLAQGLRQLRKRTWFGNSANINVQKSVVISSSPYWSIDHSITGIFEFLTFYVMYSGKVWKATSFLIC